MSLLGKQTDSFIKINHCFTVAFQAEIGLASSQVGIGISRIEMEDFIEFCYGLQISSRSSMFDPLNEVIVRICLYRIFGWTNLALTARQRATQQERH